MTAWWWWTLTGTALVLVAEGTARLLLRRSGSYVWQRYYRRTLHLDRVTHPQLEAVVGFEANADGERASACPERDDLYRILLVGGSTVESALNDQRTCWAGRLQALLNEPGALASLRVGYTHVGNVGRSGMDVRSIARILRATLPRYRRVDLIGVMVGPGDLMRWLESGAPAERMPPPISPADCFAEHPLVEPSLHPKRLALAELARRARLRWLRPVDVRENAARWMGRARTMRRDAKEVRRELPAADRFLEYFEAGLEELVREALGRAGRVVLIRQPSYRKARFEAEDEALFWNGGIGNVYSGAVPTVYFATEVMYGLLDLMDERIQRVSQRQGAEFVDPQPSVTMSRESFFDHFHLTVRGADEVGRAVARGLLAGA